MAYSEMAQEMKNVGKNASYDQWKQKEEGTDGRYTLNPYQGHLKNFLESGPRLDCIVQLLKDSSLFNSYFTDQVGFNFEGTLPPKFTMLNIKFYAIENPYHHVTNFSLDIWQECNEVV